MKKILVTLSIMMILGFGDAANAVNPYFGYGRLVDSVSGQGIPGATITKVSGDPATCSSVTSSTGNFSCSYPGPMSSCRLRFVKSNYETTLDYNVSGNEMYPVRVNANTKMTPLLGWFEGTVTMQGDIPVEGALVTTGAYNAFTDSNGYYKLFVPAGSYGLSASKNGCLEELHNSVGVSAGAGTVLDFFIPCF